MKILFTGNTAWGMYNFRRPVFEHFIKEGHQVTVAAPYDLEYQQKIEALGCSFHTIDLEAKGKNPFKDVMTFFNMRKMLKEEQPDMCFFYTIKPNIYGGMAAASLHIPYIAVTTGLGYIFNINNLTSKIAKHLYKIAFKKARQVWFLNNDDATSFKECHLIEDDKVHILPGEGVDSSLFEQHDEPTDFSFLLIARLVRDKGIPEYAQAAKIVKAKHPEVEFKLLGFLGIQNPNAVTKEELDNWVKEGHINYLGSTQDVRPFIYNSNCVVLPSYYREGVPFTLLEGAAAYRPLITCHNVGCKEVVEDGKTGFLCPVRDVQRLAQCMIKMIEMTPEERKQMGMASRQKMEREFDIKIILEHYTSAINKIWKK